MKALCARKKRLAAAVGLILAAGLGYAAWVRATGLGVPCPFHALTGLYCPGCGITRCLSALFAGQLAGCPAQQCRHSSAGALFCLAGLGGGARATLPAAACG